MQPKRRQKIAFFTGALVCLSAIVRCSGDGQGKHIYTSIVSFLSTTNYVGTNNTFTFTATGDGSPYSYSLLSGSGSINASTGVYSAPATVTGNSETVRVSVRGVGGTSADTSFTIANSGTLDTSYDSDGMAVFELNPTRREYGYAIGKQSDGKIIVAGQAFSGCCNPNLWVIRLNTDGTKDTTFGSSGNFTYDMAIGASWDGIEGMTVQSDDKIVVVGTTDSTAGDGFIIRLTSDGVLDTTFSGDGIVVVDTSGAVRDDQFESVVVQSDGKIVAGGWFRDAGNEFETALYRVDSSGTPDATFGVAGLRTFTLSATEDRILHMKVQSDDKIVAGGQIFSGTYKAAVMRFNSDGTLDTVNFGAPNGYNNFDFNAGAVDYIHGIDIDSSGRIVAAGYTTFAAAPTVRFGVARLTSSGILDTTFDSDGMVTTAFPFQATANTILALSDGKILVGGYALNAGGLKDMALARYNSDGSLDSTFGTSGLFQYDFGALDDSVEGMVIMPDLIRILTIGYANSNGAGSDLAVGIVWP